MAYNNPLMVELMVARHPETTQRIHGFFESIGWHVRNDSGSEFDSLASPDLGAYPSPTIAYWQTESPDKIIQFTRNPDSSPSEYARGLRLPHLFDMVEICMIVPTDDAVHDIFDKGGRLLEAHAHVAPREHAGRQEFRFSDPFNYALRVTADPGYEVNLTAEPLVGRRINHDEGTSYTIDEVVLRAEGYERTGELSRDVIYTQQKAGHYPAGTRYTRSENEILHGTTAVNGEQVPIFRISDTE